MSDTDGIPALRFVIFIVFPSRAYLRPYQPEPRQTASGHRLKNFFMGDPLPPASAGRACYLLAAGAWFCGWTVTYVVPPLLPGVLPPNQ
jgi:hypothetical protein